MIYDSVLWKVELKKQVNEFGAYLRRGSKVFDDDLFDIKLEKFLFNSCYIIRKLNEAYKLSDQLRAKTYKLTVYPKKSGKYPIDFWSIKRFERIYNFKQKKVLYQDIKFISNLFIHSFVLAIHSTKNNPVYGIYINTNRTKDELYFITYRFLKKIIFDVSNDEIKTLHFKRNIETGNIEFLIRSNKKTKKYLPINDMIREL